MDPGASGRPIQSVLFMCSQNAVRSPMAEALAKHFFGKSLYVQSAGVIKGEIDPFVTAIMDEYGIDIAKHKPKTITELEEWEGLNFDLVITLSPEAHHRALDLTRSLSMDVEYWPTPDPTVAQGSREQMLDSYRSVRDLLARKIKARLSSP